MKDISHKIYYGALTALGVVLCFIPLFNIVGYESAALFGVVGGVFSAFLPIRSTRWTTLFRAIGKNLFGLIFPLLILSLNAFRIPNCDFGAGLLFWIFIPVFSIAFGTGIAFLARLLFSKNWHVVVFSLIVVLFTFLDFGLRLALEPPITGHHLFLGFFSGSIYDEALSIPTSLIYFRILNLLIFATIFLAIVFFQRRTRGRLWFFVGIFFLTSLGYFYRENFGIDLSRDFIKEELGGFIESEHFEIYYPAHEPFLRDIKRIVEDHEFHYAEHRAFFKTDPVLTHHKKIKSFIYGSRNQKGKLLGARRTQVAKIWLHEIHIMWRSFGDPMLSHELAHVFTEPFGNGPLRLSAKYGVLGINMGIVEGAATAADWSSPDLDPHHVSAALRRLGKAPSLESLLSASGFWTQYSGRVYTLMGSFFRFLIDTYGIEKFKNAYPEGDIEGAYEKDLSVLVEEWEIFLDKIELNALELANAKYRYDRKSIFQKTCARKIADLRVQARRFSNRGKIDQAIEVYKKIIGFDPSNINYKIEFAQFLSRAKEDKMALDIISSISTEDLSSAQKGQVEELQGDFAWKSKQYVLAEKAYTKCLSRGLSLGHARSIQVKSRAVKDSDPAARNLAFHYLVSHKYDSISLYFPVEWVRTHPDNPIAHYLLARRLFQGQLWEKAIAHASIAGGKLESLRLEEENRKILLESYFALGDFSKSKNLAQILKKSSLNHYQVLGFEYLDRIQQKTGNSVSASIR